MSRGMYCNPQSIPTTSLPYFSVLQCVAECCSVFQNDDVAVCGTVFQRVKVHHCNTLQHTGTTVTELKFAPLANTGLACETLQHNAKC